MWWVTSRFMVLNFGNYSAVPLDSSLCSTKTTIYPPPHPKWNQTTVMKPMEQGCSITLHHPPAPSPDTHSKYLWPCLVKVYTLPSEVYTIACIAGGLRRVTTKGRGAGTKSSPLLSPSWLFCSFSVSPLPKSNILPRQMFHQNLQGPPATQAVYTTLSPPSH